MKRFLFMLALALSLSESTYSQNKINQEIVTGSVTEEVIHKDSHESNLDRSKKLKATRDQLAIASTWIVLIGYSYLNITPFIESDSQKLKVSITIAGSILNLSALATHLSYSRSIKKEPKK